MGQEWRSGESIRLPPMWPGSISGFDATRWLTLLVLYSASRGFSPGIIIAQASESNTNLAMHLGPMAQ